MIINSSEFYENPKIVLDGVFSFLNLPSPQNTIEYEVFNQGIKIPDLNIPINLKDLYHDSVQKTEQILDRKLNWYNDN